ncbi:MULTISPECIES: DNA cytosine methyltransferase [Microbacterium]|uniref:DNA cytosine methyltransferase n=1 Tax=Microbacterium TaxID=33882 RepID=UPI001C637112|nr:MULTISPECIES: DNA cytosine methyltransferase [Microbacterium]QYF98822.1 DNA cytosine methyltransferase [Microbacterium sp. PAMC21962]
MTLQLPAEVDATPASARATRTITMLDLFSGAGGLTAGFHAASDRFRVARAVELDTAAAATFAATFGEDLVYRGGIEDWLKEEMPPTVDVIVGGPPCQGFSTLGKRDATDKRNYLWQEYATTILRAQPKYFVVENVAAFAKSQQFRDFTESTQSDGILRDYTFEWDILNAADYGAFQARKRAILIGRHRDLLPVGMPEPTHVGRHRTVRQAFMNIPSTVTETRLDGRVKSFFGTELPGVFRPFELHIGRDYAEISKLRFSEIPEGGNRFDLPDRLKAPCWLGHTNGSGDVMGRLHWDKPSVTVRTEFFKPEKGRYLHPTENRAITHYEAAVLQGFPDTHRFVGSKTAIARQIGNAVPVPLGRAIAEHLLERL